ncbi:MAG: hypothetical protein SCABRO_00525, partial [Candidatus Scalindua brodae]
MKLYPVHEKQMGSCKLTINLIFRNFKVDINIVGWIKDEGRIHQ